MVSVRDALRWRSLQRKDARCLFMMPRERKSSAMPRKRRRERCPDAMRVMNHAAPMQDARRSDAARQQNNQRAVQKDIIIPPQYAAAARRHVPVFTCRFVFSPCHAVCVGRGRAGVCRGWGTSITMREASARHAETSFRPPPAAMQERGDRW